METAECPYHFGQQSNCGRERHADQNPPPPHHHIHHHDWLNGFSIIIIIIIIIIITITIIISRPIIIIPLLIGMVLRYRRMMKAGARVVSVFVLRFSCAGTAPRLAATTKGESPGATCCPKHSVLLNVILKKGMSPS